MQDEEDQIKLHLVMRMKIETERCWDRQHLTLLESAHGKADQIGGHPLERMWNKLPADNKDAIRSSVTGHFLGARKQERVTGALVLEARVQLNPLEDK